MFNVALVAAAVRKNVFTAKSPEMEIERYVKRWFQLAGDRDGGRKARELKKAAAQQQQQQELGSGSDSE